MAIDVEDIRKLANNKALLEVGRLAIQTALIDFRDSRIAMIGRGNGLVIREPDGTDSHVIRMGPEDALRIGLYAIAAHLEHDK